MSNRNTHKPDSVLDNVGLFVKVNPKLYAMCYDVQNMPQYIFMTCNSWESVRRDDCNDEKLNKMHNELLLLIFDSPNLNKNKLQMIFKSYYKLGIFQQLNKLLQESTVKALVIKCTQIIFIHYGYQAYIDHNYGLFKNENLDINTYRNLCQKLKPQSFMSCFTDICGRVSDILYLYYEIECLIITFGKENNIDTDSNNIWSDIRKSIWNEIQNLLSIFLEISSISFSLKTKTKMEDFLLALNNVNIFKIIGKWFCSPWCDSQAQILSISKSFLNNFRKTFWKSMKTNFDNEKWVVLSFPSNFGIHSIKELQRNTFFEDKNNIHNSKNEMMNEFRIYDAFLSGENIFDKLCLQKAKPLNTTIDNNHEPCITSTSLNIAKYIGTCLQIMESLDPVSYDSFNVGVIIDSLKLYFYHVFIWFGVNVQSFFLKDTERQRIVFSYVQKLYPTLTQIINEVNELLRNKKLAPELQNETRRPQKLPSHAKCYMEASSTLQLYSKDTMQGIAARLVATESLTFLVNVIKSQHDRLINISKPHTEYINKFMKQIENVDIEFKKYMYRNIPTLYKDVLSSDITNTNWNMEIAIDNAKFKLLICGYCRFNTDYVVPNDIMWLCKVYCTLEFDQWDAEDCRVNHKMLKITGKPNSYVGELIDIFIQIENVLDSYSTLPKFIHNRFNREAMIYVEEQLVEAYVDCKECNAENRALMLLDQYVLQKSYPINKYNHAWKYMNNFIQAYYLTQNDLIKWISEHPYYPSKVHKSLKTKD